MAKGDLLPDEVVLRVVTSKLDALRNTVSPEPQHICLPAYMMMYTELDT